MQQLGSDGGICTHGEGKLSLWSSQATGTLDELAAQGAELFEVPQRYTFFGCVSVRGSAEHLQFPVQIVRQHSRQHEGLIPCLGAGRHIVHLCLGLEFGEDGLLGATTVVEGDHFAGAHGLVGDEDLEVVAVFEGDEEVQLDRTLVLPPVLNANQHEAETPAPAGRFPVRLEEAALSVQAAPAFPVLDQRPEGGEARERHADGELHTLGIEQGDDLVAEEGAVQAGLDDAVWQYLPDFPYAFLDEVVGAIGVVHIPGPVSDIEDLAGLGDGTEQRVVAALPLLFAVEADRRALGEAAVDNTEPSKSSVIRPRPSSASCARTRWQTRWRRLSMPRSSSRASVRLRVATSGSRLSPNRRSTMGSSR